MNRRERRIVNKQLGLDKHYKKESYKQKFERWSENLENGKTHHKNFRSETETFIKEQDDQKVTNVIQNLAKSIAERKGIPFMDAIVEAKESYEKLRNED